MVNAPKMFMVAFGIVKPFMPEYVQKMINFHPDFDSLHSMVSKKNLPTELGGSAGDFDNAICVQQAKSMEETYFKKLKDILDKK